MKKITILTMALIWSVLSFAQSTKPVVLISGKAVNERNMQPVDVDVRVIYQELPSGAEAGIIRINPANGAYKIILPKGKKYTYKAIAPGYYSVTKYLDVTALKAYTEIDEQNLFLAPLMLDQVVRINNVFFKQKTAELLPESNIELQSFVEFLKANKKVKILLKFHTDNKGEAADNMKLTEDRLEVIKTFLKKNKIKDARIEYKAYGDKWPAAFNTTEEGRALNNRMEFVVLSLDYKKSKKSKK